jgi:predicted enzyme related to lactoylglutathione lyase
MTPRSIRRSSSGTSATCAASRRSSWPVRVILTEEATMTLADCPPTTILPVTEMDRAMTFYAERLGLPSRGTAPDGKLLFGLAGGGTLALIEKPAGAQAQHTALSFEVADIRAAIGELQARGVTFEDYDLPGLKTVEHVCVLGSEKAAWFRDPDGNYLCLHELVR